MMFTASASSAVALRRTGIEADRYPKIRTVGISRRGVLVLHGVIACSWKCRESLRRPPVKPFLGESHGGLLAFSFTVPCR
jgi:hypothetical protein